MTNREGKVLHEKKQYNYTYIFCPTKEDYLTNADNSDPFFTSYKSV